VTAVAGSHAVRGAVLGVVVSVIAAIVLVATVDLNRAMSLVGHIELLWLAPIAVVLALQALVRAKRWALVVEPMVGRPIAVLRALVPMLVGYFVNAVLPGRLGEPARAVLLARREGVRIGATAASVVVERDVDLVALLGLVAVALLVAGSPVWIPVAGGAAALALVLSFAGLAPKLVHRVPTFVPARVRSFLQDLLAAVGSVPRRRLLLVGLVSLVAWLADASLVWLVGRGIGIDVPLPVAVGIGLGGAVGTALPAAPGYIATYELGAVTFGQLAGMPAETVVPLAVFAHLLGVGSLALAGAIALGRVGGAIALRQARSASLSELTHETG
jgi:uncharacterized protein (TIRG00374 family)